MPLPTEWQQSLDSYKQKIQYTVGRKWTHDNIDRLLTHIEHNHLPDVAGIGSSRIAYKVDYEGRPTIIKFARSPTGTMQNKAEAKILFHRPNIMATGMVIPGIDYDREHPEPLWIHQEYAAPMKAFDVASLFGDRNFGPLVVYATFVAGTPTLRQLSQDQIEAAKEWMEPYLKTDFVQRFLKFAKLFKQNLADFSSPNNWGMYQKRPVIVDIGFNDVIAKRYYGKTLYKGSQRYEKAG